MEIPGHIGGTIEGMVTEPPSRQEVWMDAALVAAGIAELVSPPVAIAGIALNRLVRAAR